MDIADMADAHIEIDREANIREALNALLPDQPQVVIAGEDGAPLIICYGCNEPIPLERLAAQPHAIRCIECQREHEREELRYG